jgi:hypothetical protein
MGSLPLLWPDNDLAVLRRMGNEVRCAMHAVEGHVAFGCANSFALWKHWLAFHAQLSAMQRPKVGPWGHT